MNTLKTAQVATRLRVDSSRVVHYVKRGLKFGSSWQFRLRLRAQTCTGVRGYQYRAEDVQDFAKSRKQLGI